MNKTIITAITALMLSNSNINGQKLNIELQTGHISAINTVEFSPDGKYVLTGSVDHKIILWDVATGFQMRTFVASDQVLNAQFSTDGKSILSTDQGNYAYLWDVGTGSGKVLISNLCNYYNYSAYSPVGDFLIIGTNSEAIPGDSPMGCEYVWSTSPLKQVRKTPKSANYLNRITMATISPDGKSVLLAKADKKSIIANLLTGEELFTLKGHSDQVISACYNPDGSLIATGSVDKTIIIWNPLNGKKIKTLKGHMNGVSSLVFSPDGKNLLSASWDRTIKVWDIETGNLVHTIDENLGELHDVAYSRDGHYIISGGNDAVLWDVQTFKQIKRFEGNTSKVNNVACSNDGRFLLVSQDSKASLWNLANGKTIREYKAPSAGANCMKASFSPDNKTINTSYRPDKDMIKTVVRLFDFNTASLLNSNVDSIDGSINVAFSPSGNYIGDDIFMGNIAIYDAHTGLPLYKINEQSDGCMAIDFDPGDIFFATADQDKLVRIYDLKTGNLKSTLSGHQFYVSDVKFSPDGRLLASASYDARAVIWDVKNGTMVNSCYGHNGFLSCVNFSPDGKRLITGSWDRTAKIWDVNSCQELMSLADHNNFVTSALFMPDNKHVVTGSLDGSAKLWDTQTGEVLCTFVNLNTSDWMAITPEGYYMASKNAASDVHFVKGLNVYSFENFDLIYNRPDLVIQKIGIASQALVHAYKQAYLKRLKKMGFDESQLQSYIDLPQIELITNNLPIETNNKNITFEVKATDLNFPIDRINIWVNEAPVFGINGIDLRSQNSKSINKSVNFDLSDGKNVIKVSALNIKGVSSLSKTIEVSYAGPKSKTNLYLLTLGVSNYIDSSMNLQYAAKDANDLSALFSQNKTLYNSVYVLNLNNDKAIKANIAQACDFLKQSSVNDEVILFVAGHGVMDDKLDWYFATSDIDFSNPSTNGLSYSDLENLLDGLQARKKILLMDACNSGEIDKDENLLAINTTKDDGKILTRGFKSKTVVKSELGLENTFELMRELFANLQKGSGVISISSASGAEYAYESSTWNNGIFTYTLLEGLKTKNADLNGDGQIMVSELREYVINKVSLLTNGKQNPTSRKENIGFDFRIW